MIKAPCHISLDQGSKSRRSFNHHFALDSISARGQACPNLFRQYCWTLTCRPGFLTVINAGRGRINEDADLFRDSSFQTRQLSLAHAEFGVRVQPPNHFIHLHLQKMWRHLFMKLWMYKQLPLQD